MPTGAADAPVWKVGAADAAIWTSGAQDALANSPIVKAVTLSKSPIAYFRLNDLSGLTAADASGNGRAGTIGGGVTLGQSSGLAGDPSSASMLFNGTSGKIDVPFAAALNPALWSISAWWFESAGQAANNPIWDCRPASSGALAAGFDLFLGVNTIGISVCSTNVGQTIITWGPGATLLGVWHHTVATYDGAQVRLYGDGSLRTGPTNCPYTPNPNKPVGIAHLTLGGNFLSGQLQEIALFGAVLQLSDVSDLYLAGKTALGTSCGAQDIAV